MQHSHLPAWASSLHPRPSVSKQPGDLLPYVHCNYCQYLELLSKLIIKAFMTMWLKKTVKLFYYKIIIICLVCFQAIGCNTSSFQRSQDCYEIDSFYNYIYYRKLKNCLQIHKCICLNSIILKWIWKKYKIPRINRFLYSIF